jgi:threonine aldolase
MEGWLPPDAIVEAIGTRRGAGPRTSLLCLENTHLASGGTPLTSEQMKSGYDIAKAHDLGVHTDGARIMNAAVSLDIDVRELSQYSDTIMCCLSKGLAAPVGSVVVGSKDIIEKAKAYRGLLGGSMRQAGIIAAPGIIALTEMVDRMVEDHENAKRLGEGLERLGIELRFPVKTNMLFIDYSSIGWSGDDWMEKCVNLGWKSRGGSTGTRLVVHYGMEREDIEAFLEGLALLM